MDAVRLSTAEDVTALAPRLRPADVQELLAAGSPSALAALQSGLDLSRPCLSIVDDQDRVVTMFGVVPSGDPLVGFVWLLSSDALDHHKIKFLRHSREWLTHLHSHHPVLANMVDARNTVHIKWLQWLGFTFVAERLVGGHLFFEFVRLQHV